MAISDGKHISSGYAVYLSDHSMSSGEQTCGETEANQFSSAFLIYLSDQSVAIYRGQTCGEIRGNVFFIDVNTLCMTLKKII